MDWLQSKPDHLAYHSQSHWTRLRLSRPTTRRLKALGFSWPRVELEWDVIPPPLKNLFVKTRFLISCSCCWWSSSSWFWGLGCFDYESLFLWTRKVNQSQWKFLSRVMLSTAALVENLILNLRILEASILPCRRCGQNCIILESGQNQHNTDNPSFSYYI